MRKLIANCPAPIAEAFQKDGNLQSVSIPRLWKEFYPVLERILHDGVEATSKTLIERDIALTTQAQYPTGHSENNTPGHFSGGPFRRDLPLRYKEGK